MGSSVRNAETSVRSFCANAAKGCASNGLTYRARHPCAGEDLLALRPTAFSADGGEG